MRPLDIDSLDEDPEEHTPRYGDWYVIGGSRHSQITQSSEWPPLSVGKLDGLISDISRSRTQLAEKLHNFMVDMDPSVYSAISSIYSSEPSPASQVLEIVHRLQADMEILGGRIDEIAEHMAQQPLVKSTSITDLAEPRLRLRQPVWIVIEQYEDGVTASWPEVAAFGSGDSDGEAILALKADIVAHYEHLASTPDSRLGKLLRSQKRVLLQVVVNDETP